MTDRDYDPERAADPFNFYVTEVAYVIERTPNPAWRLRHFSNSQSHILVLALAGAAHYEIAGTAHRIERGHLAFMPAGTEHTAESDRRAPWHFLSVAFQLGGRGADEETLRTLPSVLADVSPEVPRVFREMHAAWVSRQPGHHLQVRALTGWAMHQVVRAAVDAKTPQPYTGRIAAITRTIRENVTTTYSVNELAALAGLSPSHFRLVFKRVTGLTVTTYQQRVKIAKATEYLASGEYNVTETARLAGFSDVYYFSRTFKRITGYNPSILSRR